MSVDFTAISQFGQSNPAGTLIYVDGAKSVRRVGTEKLRGVQTTHYKGVGDIRLLKERAPADVPPSIETLDRWLESATFPMDVWIDAEALIRWMSVKMPYADDVPFQVPFESVESSMEYFDFGVPVSVKFPPPSKVEDITDLRDRDLRF